MARAFIASIPLAIVAVAALVVPLAVIPGTFGFQSWPTAPGDRATDNQVVLAPPPRIQVARKPPHSSKPPVTRTVAQLPQPAKAAPTAAPAPSSPGRRAPAVAQGPRGHDPHHGTPSSSVGQPSTPAAPQEPAPATPQPPPDAVATVDPPPIARPDPAANPVVTPPPSPVEEVKPAEPPVRPASPVDNLPLIGHGHGHDDGHGDGHGDCQGDGQGDDRGHGIGR
jgi:hypothetical protein